MCASDGRGFPPGFRSTPVPNLLLSGLLEEIDDLDELKVTLRAIWFIHAQRTFPASVRVDDLLSDRTTAAMLHAAGEGLERAVQAALEAAVHRGTLLRVEGEGEPDRYFLNTQPVRRAVREAFPDAGGAAAETWPGRADAGARPSVFAAYEANIGELTPLMAGRLKDALQEYSEEWLHDAIEAAADARARNWNYIAAVLRGYKDRGRPDGEPGRHPEEHRSDEYIRRYLTAQRERGNR